MSGLMSKDQSMRFAQSDKQLRWRQNILWNC